MSIEPAGYRLEWKPGEYCYYSAEDYARETYRDGARVHGLFHHPQPDCPADVNVYRGWCWVQPKYDHGIRDESFMPLYLGPLLHEPPINEGALFLFPSLVEDRLRREHPHLFIK